MASLKTLFLLDPSVAFLNHGSFGAAPRAVMEAYQSWQIRLEQRPIQFMDVELPALLASARAALGAYLGAPADDLVLVPNVTFAVNAVARSLDLGPGDEIVGTDHEYGACDRAWRFLSQKSGFRYVRQHIALPRASDADILEGLWQAVTPRTRLIFASHITSPTALTLPVAALCSRARQAGILTMIDGAHAPGQIPLDVASVGADFYTGNCHKWMMAPKGSAFLYARPEVQARLEPLVVSWGWQPVPGFTTGSPFLDIFQWGGTDDPSASLAVPAAIDFMQQHDWPEVQLDCHQLLRETLGRVSELTGLPDAYGGDDGLYHQMAIAFLPDMADPDGFKKRMYAEHLVEVPITEWNDRRFLRVSIQGYNTQADVERLLEALRSMLQR
ncbi:MAG: aminotransferase class V-fold PLP-dependent enzyme [Anaerolineales bacterium]